MAGTLIFKQVKFQMIYNTVQSKFFIYLNLMLQYHLLMPGRVKQRTNSILTDLCNEKKETKIAFFNKKS